MTIINPPKDPLNILVTKTLTLPEVSETDRQRVAQADSATLLTWSGKIFAAQQVEDLWL